MDVLSASSSDKTIAWYENDGAADPTFTASDITTSASGATGVFAVDLDDDGDMDVLSASQNDDTIAWYENQIADPADKDFIITVKTDNTGASADTEFTIPTTGTGYNYNVDCDNDGTDEVTGATGDYTCDYATGNRRHLHRPHQGQQRRRHRLPPDLFQQWRRQGLKLLTIEQWGTGKWTSMDSAFRGCSNLTVHATDTPDLSNVTDMSTCSTC